MRDEVLEGLRDQYALLLGIALGSLNGTGPHSLTHRDDTMKVVLQLPETRRLARAHPDRLLNAFYRELGMEP